MCIRDRFKDVELKFVPGNCYGIIGANGAGKSTFLRILSGDLEPTTGEVIIPKEERMSILKQDHFQYDAYTVLDTVMMGNQRLYDVMKEKDALYEKEDFKMCIRDSGCPRPVPLPLPRRSSVPCPSPPK